MHRGAAGADRSFHGDPDDRSSIVRSEPRRNDLTDAPRRRIKQEDGRPDALDNFLKSPAAKFQRLGQRRPSGDGLQNLVLGSEVRSSQMRLGHILGDSNGITFLERADQRSVAQPADRAIRTHDPKLKVVRLARFPDPLHLPAHAISIVRMN